MSHENIEDLLSNPSEKVPSPDETQSYLPLSDNQIEMIQKRVEEKGITSEEALRELQGAGAFQDTPVQQIARELDEELADNKQEAA